LIWFKYYGNGKVLHGTREVGSFWWKDLLKLCVLYRGIAKCQIGDGSIVLFWEDLCSSGVLAVKYPCLFSFAKAQRISVKSVVEAEDLASLFALPLSSQAYDELQDMKVELSMVH